MHSRLLTAALCATLLGCGTSQTSNDDGGQPLGSDGGTLSDAGSNQDAGTGSDGGTDAGTPFAHCPTVELPSAETQTYNGDTTGKPDLVYDVFIELGKNVPDDALVFKAPSAGTYRLKLKSTPQTNGGCALAFGRNSKHTRADCPVAPNAKDYGSTGLGFIADGANEFKDFTLAANEEVMFYFGCTYWSQPEKFGAYQITLEKQ